MPNDESPVLNINSDHSPQLFAERNMKFLSSLFLLATSAVLANAAPSTLKDANRRVVLVKRSVEGTWEPLPSKGRKAFLKNKMKYSDSYICRFEFEGVPATGYYSRADKTCHVGKNGKVSSRKTNFEVLVNDKNYGFSKNQDHAVVSYKQHDINFHICRVDSYFGTQFEGKCYYPSNGAEVGSDNFQYLTVS